MRDHDAIMRPRPPPGQGSLKSGLFSPTERPRAPTCTNGRLVTAASIRARSTFLGKEPAEIMLFDLA